jgi:hypothetical protein
MESRLESGRDGIRIPDSTLEAPELRLVWALELASLADLAGAGDTGDMTGVATELCSTTTATFPIVEFSSIAATSTTAADFMAAPDFTAATLGSGAVHHPMGLRVRMDRAGLIPARSVGLITEEPLAASPRAGSRASAEVFTVVGAFTVAEATEVAVTGNRCYVANAPTIAE